MWVTSQLCYFYICSCVIILVITMVEVIESFFSASLILPLSPPHPLLQNLLGIKNVRRDFHYAIYDLCRNIAETK